MKTLLLLLIVSGNVVLNLVAQPVPPVATNAVALTPALVRQLLAEVRTNHPALRAAAARVDAANFNVASVRTWEDPMFLLGGTLAGPRRGLISEDGDITYGLEQKLPLWGKPQLARALAASEVQMQRAEVEFRIEMLRRDLVKVLLRVALAGHVVESAAQDIAWLETMTALATERLRAGQATAVEVLTLQNEQAKRTSQRRADEARLATETTTVNRLLNRPLDAAWPPLALPPLAPALPQRLTLQDKAASDQPRLSVMRREIEQAQAAARVTRSTRLPDISLGVQGRQYSEDAGFREGMFTLSFNLPWINAEKYRSDLRRDEAKVKALEAELLDFQLGLREEVHHVLVSIDNARREALLYRDEILPRTQQTMAVARTAWENGRGMMRDVLDTRRMLLEGQLMQVRAVADQHQMLADLALACGLESADAISALLVQPAPSPERNPKP